MTICVAEPASFIETLLTVAANAGGAARTSAAVSAAMRPPRRPVRARLVSSRILVTLFRLQLDRQGLGFAERVLHHLQLALADSRDISVQHRVSDSQHVSMSAAVFHQRELVGSAPHDAHQMDVAHVDQRPVGRMGLEAAVEKRLNGSRRPPPTYS